MANKGRPFTQGNRLLLSDLYCLFNLPGFGGGENQETDPRPAPAASFAFHRIASRQGICFTCQLRVLRIQL